MTKICKPDSKECEVYDEAVYKLDTDGIIPPGQTIEDEEILIGKILLPSDTYRNSFEAKGKFKDTSLRSRRA
jgi:DNA-directed RNA polymerase beta subunit